MGVDDGRSRFNIPAPTLVKPGYDVCAGEGLALDRASRPERGGRGGFGRTGSFKPHTEKTVQVFPRPPVPQTDTGGWVEYTQARE